MATVCSFCGQQVPPGGDARFCAHCGTLVPHPSAASPDTQMPKHEQLAKQPSARTAPPQNATPWLGLPGASDAGNVTPWLGLPAPRPGNELPKSHAAAPLSDLPQEDFPTAIISTSSMDADAHVEDLPTAIISPAASAADQSRNDRRERATRRRAEEIDQLPTAQMYINVKPPRVAVERAAYQPRRLPRRRARPLLFGIVTGIVILVVAVGIWIMLAQPFAVSAATNPTQTTTSAPLGLVITYPASWKATQTATVLALTDSSDTAQMKITQSNSANIDQTSYLKQQAAALGMSDAKAGSVISFAGSSWQQTQGDFVINGADYIGSIYVTAYNNQLYTLIQTAPKVTFQDEESLIFAPARASLRFN